jgi:hypothetical protein
MIGYLDQLFSEQEYRAKKNQILADKQGLNERLKTLNQTHETRFEPCIRFVNRLKEAKIAASSTDDAEKRDFLKKVGSNLELVNRTLRFVPRNAWQLVVDSGRLAQRTTAPAIAGAGCVGETDQNLSLAESMIPRSNQRALLDALKQFFKDNPGAECSVSGIPTPFPSEGYPPGAGIRCISTVCERLNGTH